MRIICFSAFHLLLIRLISRALNSSNLPVFSYKNARVCLIIKIDLVKRYASIEGKNAFTHCWRHVKFRNILLLRLVKHIGEYMYIRKYSLFCRSAFLLIPTASSSLPGRRDFLSGKGKHADHKRRFRKTPPSPSSPSVLRCGSMRIVHSANIAQPRPVVLPFTDVPEVRASWKKLCFLLAQRAVRTCVFFRSSSPCPSSF